MYRGTIVFHRDEMKMYKSTTCISRHSRVGDFILYFNCFWNIESINTNQILPKQFIYRIENMFYKGPMYASSFIFNVGWYKRSIFVWNREENSQSKKSKWIIDCASGEFMYSK